MNKTYLLTLLIPVVVSCWQFRVIGPELKESEDNVDDSGSDSDHDHDYDYDYDYDAFAYEGLFMEDGVPEVRNDNNGDQQIEVEPVEDVFVDAGDCPAGYDYDPESQSCVSFCEADEYFEEKRQKCLKYPCCDLAGHWELKLLDEHALQFETYQVNLQQIVSYLSCEFEADSEEMVECQGSLQNNHFFLTCDHAEWYLTLDGLAQEDKVNGMYVLDNFDGSEVEGPFNLK